MQEGSKNCIPTDIFFACSSRYEVGNLTLLKRNGHFPQLKRGPWQSVCSIAGMCDNSHSHENCRFLIQAELKGLEKLNVYSYKCLICKKKKPQI